MVSQNPEICLLLHNIRSTHNVGSIFRTSDAVAIKKIYISGYTPTPIDRFGRIRKDIAKVSLGAEKDIEWQYIENIKNLIKDLKKSGFKIVALEQDEKSVDYRKCKKTREYKNILLIVGNEVGGIEKEILDLCDEIVEIPMFGNKESLNVSVATGIILYALKS